MKLASDFATILVLHFQSQFCVQGAAVILVRQTHCALSCGNRCFILSPGSSFPSTATKAAQA